MKSFFLLLSFVVLWSCSLHAQTLDSIAHHYAGVDGEYDVDIRGFLALRDGTVVANGQLFFLDEEYHISGDYGLRLYKIDPNGPSVLDSLFIEDNDMNYFLLERNPFDDDNILAGLFRDLEEDRTLLHICFFDDDLQLNNAKDVWVPLCDTAFEILTDGYCLDPNGDIVAKFKMPDMKTHFVRVGLDGTVKCHRVDYDEAIWNLYTHPLALQLYNSDPIEYAYCGLRNTSSTQTRIYVLDTMFVVKEYFEIPWKFSGIAPYRGWACDGGDGTFLFCSRFSDVYPNVGNGVQITRFTKDGQTPLTTAIFHSNPMVIVGSGTFGCAESIGLAPAGDGGWYYAYTSQDPVVYGFGQIGVARLDRNLNVIWHRYCLEPEGYSRWSDCNSVVVMDDGTVAVGGLVFGDKGVFPAHFFFLFLDNDGVGLPGSEAFIRPFAFWPNPADERLSLEFSPDVNPVKLELYDLNGRLLLTQNDRFGSMDLSGLPAGLYTLRVTLSDGITYSDKVVKQ